ncbi:MAG: ATP-binding protein [Eubacterium sp.]|nr:ATP-binding protein [Eubacterium sp.]
MKPFVGRKQELQTLENAYNKRDAFVLVTGRRGVGKTELIRGFTNSRCCLYFTAKSETDSLARRRMMKAIFEFSGEGGGTATKLMKWKEIFERFAAVQKPERKVLVIDDLQYLLAENPGFERQLSYAIKNFFAPASIMVILIMPLGKICSDFLDNRRGLAKVLSHRISLKPVSFVEMIQEYPHRDFNQLALLYAIAGGMPAYWEYFKDCETSDDYMGAVRARLLDRHAFLFDEPGRLLEADIWEPALYYGILRGIAAGYRQLSELARFLDEKPAKILKALDILKFMGYVDARGSVLDKKMPVPKKRTYIFADPMMDLWFSFVYPYREVLEMGKDLAVFEGLKRDFPEYMKFWYQEICMEIFRAACRQQSFPFKLDRLGCLRTKDGETIDLVAVDEVNRRVFMAECVYGGRPYTMDAFEAFKEHCGDIRALRAFKDYTKVYGVFTSEGFDADLMDYCMITPGIMLFGGITLYSANQ